MRVLPREIHEERPRGAGVPPREAWTDAHSEAATLARCVGDAVGAGGGFELRDARNASIALLARGGGGTSWRALLGAARPRACGGPPPPAPAETAWVASEAAVGFCGVTNDGVEGDCARQGSKGSWANGVHRIRGMDDCVGRCLACDGCRYVTYSAENEDCSWYWSCDVGRLSRDPAFRTLQVRRAGADVGGGGRRRLGHAEGARAAQGVQSAQRWRNPARPSRDLSPVKVRNYHQQNRSSRSTH